MARVTKINVGGTNYDIAHEGELKNSGFEVVTSLPTTGLFNGREVMYNGKKYVYSSGWEEEITANTMYEANLLWGGRNIAGSISPTDVGMMSELSANVMAFPNPTGISIEYSRDGGVTWLDYGATDEQKVKLFTTEHPFHCGKEGTANLPLQLRITITPMEWGAYTSLNKIIVKAGTWGISKCMVTFKGLRGTNVDAGNEDDSFYETIIDRAYLRENPAYNVLNFNTIYVRPASMENPSFYHNLRLIFEYEVEEGSTIPPLTIYSLRFFGLRRFALQSNLARTGHLYAYDWKQNALFPAKVNSKEVINFNVNNIEPTQTGSSVSKTSTWLWQYLTQAVNWLKANNVRLSAYNTKVAALEQADSDNNASIQSVNTDLTELSNGLAAVARSGSYNDLTDKPSFSGSYNDLTDKPNLATVATSGNYDDLLNKPALVFSNIGGNVATAQITDGSITNAKLANSSMSLNDTTVNLGDTAILPWYVDYNEVDYPARIREHWLQIYRNGVWANLVYLGDILPTQVGQITSLDNLDWYNEQVSEYEVDSNTTQSILAGTTLPATLLLNCLAEQLTLNLYPISGKEYGKGSLDSLISDLQGKGFSVFVENDIDAILASGSDYLVRLKISKVPTAKAIIECYVAR